MADECRFCGIRNHAHKELACKAELDALQAQLAEARAELERQESTYEKVTQAHDAALERIKESAAENERLRVAFARQARWVHQTERHRQPFKDCNSEPCFSYRAAVEDEEGTSPPG